MLVDVTYEGTSLGCHNVDDYVMRHYVVTLCSYEDTTCSIQQLTP